MDDDERCPHRWNDGRPCSHGDGVPHACQLVGEHRTHVCPCLATDTPRLLSTAGSVS
jgi:hypothetical protein